MVTSDLVQAEAQSLLDSGLLGRSAILRRLFGYLAGLSIDDRSPKEIEVAMQVFGRASSFDPGQDAVVRVYMHKLRKRLEIIYDGPRRSAEVRLTVPLGEYRLAVLQDDDRALERATDAPAQTPFTRSLILWTTAGVVMLMVIASAATWVAVRASWPPALKEALAVRASPVWSPLASNGFPTLVVMGDYYIFGESDDEMQTDRLVREYSVNSSADLDQFLIRHPEKLYHYLDLNLRYLPVGSASALRSVAPLVESWRDRRNTRVIMASELTPQMLKTNNIVYIGYFSGLGALKDLVFASSRFTIGQTYDDIHDSVTKTEYDSQGGGPSRDGVVYRDYGYVSALRGPGGNRIMVIAGTRDVGLMQTAEAVTRLEPLKEITRRVANAPAFEALYEVNGIDRLNMSGRLLVASPLDEAKMRSRSNAPKLVFPSG